MSKFEQISTFVSVADQLGFAAAARNLGISTPAVSKQISLLEAELGLSLFKRSTRKVELTDMGQSYYLECRKILSDLKAADAMVKEQHQEPEGLLRVTAGRHFAQRYIIPGLSTWLGRYPKIRLNLELAERIPDLQKEGIDILIGMSMSGPLDCIQRQIAQTRYVYCASSEYLAEHGTPQKLSDLKNHNVISHSMRPGESNDFKSALTLNDTQAMLQCAIDGIGIVKLHDYVVQEAISQGKLQKILGDQAEPNLPLYVCYLLQRFMPARIRCFIDFCEAEVSKAKSLN